MPVATSSSRRRKTARQPSSDIEEDQPTQNGHAQEDVDDDEEDDAPPTRRVKKEKEKAAVKKEKEKATKSQPRKEDVEDDDEDDDDDRIDIDNFADQSLTKADGTKIHGLSKDWGSIEEAMRQPSPIIARVASSMAEVAGEEAQESLAELEQVMKGLLDAQALMVGHSKVLSDIIQSVARGEQLTNANDKYMQLVDDMNAEYDAKTARQKYGKSDQYVAFKEAIYEVDHAGHAMPPITDFIPREDGDESDDDDDVVMGGITQEYKCPLMMTLLVDPLTSSVCKHSFSGAAIKDMFKNNRGSMKCPAAGCSKSFTLSDCKPNPDLAHKVKAHERRQARAQEDSDAEEVID